MLSIPATIAWFVFLFAVLWAFQRMTKWLTRLNIFSLFLGFLVLRHGLTVPFDHTVNQWYAGISLKPETFVRFYTSLVLMWTCILAGVWGARRLLGRAEIDPDGFKTAIKGQILPPGVNRLFLPAVVIGLVLICIYQVRTEINFWKLITAQLTSSEYRSMRDSYGVATHFSGGIGYRLANIVRFGLLPTFVCTLLFLWRRHAVWALLFALSLGLGLLVGLLSGQKGATLFLLLGVGIAMYYKRGQMRLRPTDLRIWGLAAAGIGGVVFLYHLQYPEQTFGWAFKATTYRLTSEADRSLQLYYEVYPDVQPFMYGRSSSLINGLIGAKIPIDELPERFIPTYYLGPSYLNTWNGAFIGVAWADFGYAGVIFQSLFVGALLYAYAFWFARARKTALVMGTQVGLMMASTRLSEVALSASLLTFGLLSSFLVYLTLRRPATQKSAELPKEKVQVPV